MGTSSGKQNRAEMLIKSRTVARCLTCPPNADVVVPFPVTTIGDNAFIKQGCQTLTVPDTLTFIGNKSFFRCGVLTSLSLPNAVADIGAEAFANCSDLTSVTLPNTFTRIRDGAFSGCAKLTSVVFRPPASRSYITWAVSNMRNRKNWQITSVKQMRNIVRLIMIFAFHEDGRDAVSTIDPRGERCVFKGCFNLNSAYPRRLRLSDAHEDFNGIATLGKTTSMMTELLCIEFS